LQGLDALIDAVEAFTRGTLDRHNARRPCILTENNRGDGPVENIEKRAMRRAKWRLVPLLCFCYFIAYLDRVNAGFAKLQMNKSLGLDDSMFGLGAGLFFIAYLLLGVPSNLALDRVGARRWIACIMIT
jgi:ACS family tartrate transporter-like MFS transporter